MQLQFRIDDTNYVTVQFQLSAPLDGSALGRPEIIAATISASELSHLKTDDVFDLAGQIVDHFASNKASEKPAADWFTEEWLPQCK